METQYNAFEHLWRSIFPITAEEKIMAMLTAYLDESGKDGRSPILAIGGYISTQDKWEAFQTEWETFRIQTGIDIFHATDLIGGYGNFSKRKGWNEDRAQAALSEFDALIRKHTLFGAVTFINIAKCEEVWKLGVRGPKTVREKFEVEYAMTGMLVILAFTQWAEINAFKEPIRFVFETGVKGRGHIKDAVDFATKGKTANAAREYLIGGVSFERKPGIPQLYTADRLVNAACKAINGARENDTSVIDDLGYLMEELNLHSFGTAPKELLPVIAEWIEQSRQNEERN